jgi:iron-sulfur cluster assembly protein
MEKVGAVAGQTETGLVRMTPKAVTKVRELLAAKNRTDLSLRLYVSAGGCRGFSYGMAWDAPDGDDYVFDHEGVRLIVDPLSAQYLDGAEVDFSESLMGGGFTIHNPNAVNTCGCGQSFRTEGEGGQACSCGH